MTRYHVCAEPGCPNLVSKTEPCPIHGRNTSRPANAPWSTWRNGAEQKRWRRAAIKAQPYCTVCGTTDKLDVHHGEHGEPVVLCNQHHCEIDPRARPR